MPASNHAEDTYQHIGQVQHYLMRAIQLLLHRLLTHDASKLQSPEREGYEQLAESLRSIPYGSPAYYAQLERLRPVLAHHYAHNPHHPEAHPDGIRGMTLVDILEMVADWKASSLRHQDGDIRSSIFHNQHRFGFSDELRTILLNTLEVLE